MLFNSFIFLLFLALFFLLWTFLKRTNSARWIYITIASFIFYAWWDWRFLFLIIFSGLVDFLAGLKIARSTNYRRFWLVISLAMNIGALSIFKYSLFFATTLDTLLAKIGIASNLQANIPAFALILPVGISFYTFQSMSYTIDIYRGRLNPTRHIFHFFAYLSMFPQLVAGPIIRAKDLLKQLTQNRRVNLLEFWHGLKLIVVGFFQKTVLADNIGEMVNYAYHSPSNYSGAGFWWLVAIGFALQIYFDFSGYSLIARGIAKWMGYHFKMNFNHPYLATSLKTFWRRWHISLSTWFRDYVYIPMGGSKKGVLLSHLLMWFTMILSGFWHGAAITFILWGALHAIFLSFERVTFAKTKLIPKFINYLATMLLVLIAWVYFRATSVSNAHEILANMFEMGPLNLYWEQFENSYFFLLIAMLFEFVYFLSLKNKTIKTLSKTTLAQSLEVAILTVGILFFRGPEQAFIYFQF